VVARLWHRHDAPEGDTQVANPQIERVETERVEAERSDADRFDPDRYDASRAEADDTADPADSVDAAAPPADRTDTAESTDTAETTDTEDTVPVTTEPIMSRRIPSRPVSGARDVTPDRDGTPDERPARARGSLMANIGLIVSVVGFCAVLTGVLAPEGVVIGLIGGVISLIGFGAGRRPGVTGSGAATLGLIIGLAAIALGAVAMTGNYSWPNSRVNEAQRWHDWFVRQWSWLSRW
jgi:hypothetical protein